MSNSAFQQTNKNFKFRDLCFTLLACSSAVERLPVKQDVEGSIPFMPVYEWFGIIKFILGYRQTGKALDFDSRIVGSTPATPAYGM